MKKVIYLAPDFADVEHFRSLSDAGKLAYAKNPDAEDAEFVSLLSLSGFAEAFNSELISDLGFVFFVDDNTYDAADLRTMIREECRNAIISLRYPADDWGVKEEE